MELYEVGTIQGKDKFKLMRFNFDRDIWFRLRMREFHRGVKAGIDQDSIPRSFTGAKLYRNIVSSTLTQSNISNNNFRVKRFQFVASLVCGKVPLD
jgi:hypothetical protein